MPQIDSLVRDLVWQRLIDPALGFTAQVEAEAGAVDPNTGEGVYANIDASMVTNDGWDLGTNCLFGYMAKIEDVEGSTAMTYPFTRIWTRRQSGRRLVLSALYSGVISFYIQHDISWIDSPINPYFHQYEDLVREALTKTFNDPNAQIFAPGVSYNGDFTPVTSPVREGGQNWIQSIGGSGSFTVVVCS